MKQFGLKWSFFLTGLVILGCGIAMTFKGSWYGVSSWDVLHYGLYTQLGLTVGSWSILVGLSIIISTWLITKKAPQVGAYINMLTVGMFIDLFLWILPETTSFLWQSVYYFGGVVVIGAGIGLYVSGGVGAGPRDHLMLWLSERTGWSVAKTRGLMEIVVLFIGYLLGGPVGIGTFILAFGLGPCIQLSLKLAKKLFQWIEVKLILKAVPEVTNNTCM
ncbi:YczE/YyaS/YitT family protein [Mangrovibacillus cuniculi]|uniref:YitT family protein n=1 Tax=Mangrovibacillus cuniculi TaxID=2593652 RepID=A0A7S8CAK3_9BACI|nr:YitT family protein [Mangrovibacillus cuniculi]QPC46456.1 YitT family protein [Mangrovibacillus cuniculi]